MFYVSSTGRGIIPGFSEIERFCNHPEILHERISEPKDFENPGVLSLVLFVLF